MECYIVPFQSMSYAWVQVAPGTRLNVRSGPGTNFTVIGSLNRCDHIRGRVFEQPRDPNWFRMTNGGYVAVEFIYFDFDGDRCPF